MATAEFLRKMSIADAAAFSKLILLTPTLFAGSM
jgi:hypothetical protein